MRESHDNTKPLIAIDIDDVVASVIETVRLWANEKTGASLTHEDYHTGDNYWEYYNRIWERHGLHEQINFDIFLAAMEQDQSHIPLVDDARHVIGLLRTAYDVAFITSRPMSQKDATRRWLDEHIGSDVPLYIAHNSITNADARSKGEICAELGASVLIDDNVGNCQSAQQYGIEAILFGNYGWNEKAPNDMVRCYNWREVGEQLLDGVVA